MENEMNQNVEMNENEKMTEEVTNQTDTTDVDTEYVTFMVTASDGQEVEMAVVDEFDFENKHYVVSARVVDDTISDEGQYIYRAKMEEDDFTVEKIKSSVDYKRVVRAYMEME